MQFGIWSNGFRPHTSPAQTYEEDLQEIVLADQLDMRDAYISEHHGDAYISEHHGDAGVHRPRRHAAGARTAHVQGGGAHQARSCVGCADHRDRARWCRAVGPGQVVLRVRDGQFFIDRIPSDWIASDYLRERKPQPPDISFIALNPRRNVSELPGGAGVLADTGFVREGVSPNLLMRTRFWTDKTAKLAYAFTAGVYGVRDEAEARTLLQALEELTLQRLSK